MKFCEALDLPRGITAVIGSGGKTSLLMRLAEEVPGTAILCTTTHIVPFSGYPVLENPSPEALRRVLADSRVVCIGTPGQEGKLTAPRLPMETLAALADYVLVEADGSHQRPLKAHAPHEPVIPSGSRRVICVVGASGFGRPIQEAVHRPERFCALTGASAVDPAAPELAARALIREALCNTVLLNQLEGEASHTAAAEFAAAMAGRGFRIWGGSLRENRVFPLSPLSEP